MQYRVLAEKLKEAAASVLPVTAIVAVLCLALVRVDVGLMLSFLLGSGLLILGMGLFTLGAELSMSRIGNLIGAKMTEIQKALVHSCGELSAGRRHYDGRAGFAGAGDKCSGD